MRPRMLVPFVCLILLTAAATAGAKTDPAVTTLAANPSGLQLRVDVPADADSWQGLVAVPAGKRAALLTTAATIELGEPAVMHGIQLVPLRVAPAADGTRSRDVALSFTADPAAPATRRTKIAETFANLLESQVIGASTVRDQFTVVPGTYLAIVSSASGAMEAVEPLLEWRRQQGYNVIAVTTAETGTGNTAIKSYIQQVYNTAESPLAHVVLVGDANGGLSVATWYEGVSGYHGEGDHYYVELQGGDVLADAHIGRLTARNTTELQGIVTKILGYERNPDTFTDPGWFSSAVLVGDPSSSGTSTIYVNQWLKEQLLEPMGYTRIDTIWSGNFSSQITLKLNQGASVYSYRGYLGMSGFSPSHIDNLQNQGELPFAIMVTCGSGSFADDSHGYSEAMLRNPHGGAIGAVGTATWGTHTRYNNCYFHGAWQGALGEKDRALGYAHTRGKIELYRQYQGNEPDKVEVWSVWNNLMGDPATEMRQSLPLTPTVTYPAQLPPDAGTLPVLVTDPGGQPLSGVRVAAYREGDDQACVWTDATGQALLPLPDGVAPGEVAVTVTGDDLVPHRGTTMLGAVNAYCVEAGWTWDDGDDGMPDPGETGDLTVTVRNLGQQTAPAVSVDLTPLTDGTDVATGVVYLGDLAAGEEVPAGPWTVTLAEDLPDGDAAVLTLTAVSSADTWLSRVDLPVTAPAFRILLSSWDAVPGATATLSLTMRNDGSVAAPGAVASFASSSNYLMPAGDVDAELGDVAPGTMFMVTYQIAIAPDAYGGHLADCDLTVTTAAGTRQVLELPLTVGGAGATEDNPVTGDLDYVAWDNEDPSPHAPVYAWREIDPSYGGGGTDVGLTDFSYEDDDTRTLDLPFSFRFNGRDYDQISICSNGWISFGQTYLVHWRNWGLPAAGAPDNMVCVFWDNLVQSSSNRVYYEHVPAEGVYVVQWSRMRNRSNGVQNCEVILYDPAVHPTETGDGLMVMQYQQATNNDTSRGYATVGIQDGESGINYTYYNRYDTGARTLAGGRAIAWVPMRPHVPASVTVTPESLDFVLMPGQIRAAELEIASDGPTGSVLNWQLVLQEDVAAPAQRDPGVTLLSPNGGEQWSAGEIRMIAWTSSEVQQVRLLLDRGLGDGYQPLAENVDASLGSWAWVVTGPASATCHVRVVDQSDIFVADTSDAAFAINVDYSWIELSANTGQTPAGETATVTVTIDATNLPVGTYQLDLVVMSSGGAPITVPVNVLVDETTAAPDLPTTVRLAQNAPNPFNPRTTIAFALPADGPVLLTVHDLRGRLVRTLRHESMPAGQHAVVFDGVGDDGRSLASGTYLYRLLAGGEVVSRRLTLVK